MHPRHFDRGRDSVLVYAAPPTEPCVRLSRTRLSSRPFTSQRGPAPRHWPTQDRPPVSAFRWFGHATFRRSGAGFASGVLALAGNRFRIVSPRPLFGRVCLPAALCSAGITPLLSSYGGSDSCRAGSSGTFCYHELPSCPGRFACSLSMASAWQAMSASLPFPSSRVLSFPDILSPTTPAGSSRASVMRRGGCGARAPQTSPVTRRLVAAAGAESCSFVIMVCLVVSVAPHPASRRRSYFNFSAAQRLPPA